MKKTIYALTGFLSLLILNSNTLFGQAKIKAYFNHPVNNSVSTGVNAVYLPSGTMADTVVAYIGRAKYSIDIAQYDYNQDTWNGAYANIAAAVDTAYAHGITVRWIYNGSSSNGGLSALSPGIHKLASPTTSAYGIMHNKFIIIDANSSDPADPILCTGSEDWSSEMFHQDYNNILFIQDSALANAYTAEFNMMWGSTTAIPDTSMSKFGPHKTDLGLHTFTIAGHQVELYFSPSDNTESHLESTILTANTDLYVGVYDMTESEAAYDIVTRKNSGVYTIAIVDQYTPQTSSGVNSTLSSGLGSNYVVYASNENIYHNKMMVIDPSDTCSDPMVETGSHNWTSSANNYNDENILIIHNDTLANIYYQSIIQDYAAISGHSFARFSGPCGDVNTEKVEVATSTGNSVGIYPNPARQEFTVSYTLASETMASIVICNTIGQQVAVPVKNEQQAGGPHNYQCAINEPGIYFVVFTLGGQRFEQKLVIAGE